jgi:hypothetical protein
MRTYNSKLHIKYNGLLESNLVLYTINIIQKNNVHNIISKKIPSIIFSKIKPKKRFLK